MLRHSVHVMAAIVVALVSYVLPTSMWRTSAPFILLGVLVLLVMVLVPGVGRSVNGAYRWIRLGVNIQVSEVAKLGFIFYLSSYVYRKQDLVQTSFGGALAPLGVMVVLSGLILLEPDFGGVFMILLIGGSMLYFSGLPWRVIILLLLSVILVMSGLIFTAPYRLGRLKTFFDPWANPFGDGYQLTQSLMAVGRGGVTGVGLGYGLQKQLYLPEAHTDFMFAVLAEELGLVGAGLLVMLFVMLMMRLTYWIHIAVRRNLSFEAMVLYGVMIWWSASVIISMCVNLGLVPTKGIALPFISYGGSNLLVNACASGVILKITKNLSKER